MTAEDPIWVRIGGGLELVPGGDRHGPADPNFPPPGEGWQMLTANGRLVGWGRESGKGVARRAVEAGGRIEQDRRSHLLGRLGHKMRSSVLALQESARQAAFGRQELLEQIYDQAQEVGRRAAALEAVALDPKDVARAVVIGAVLNLAAPGAARDLPPDAVVRAAESVLVEALTRAYEWMGGAGTVIDGRSVDDWWRLELIASANREPLPLPEVGEPLVRLLVDTHLQGWLDASQPGRAVIFLPKV